MLRQSALGAPHLLRQRRGRINSYRGRITVDFAAASGMPAGASFSGTGSYGGAGIIATQNTGTVTHEATGWSGQPCLAFVPSSDNAELRLYNAAGWDIYSPDGLGMLFEMENLDTAKFGFYITLDYCHSATDLYPATNIGYMRYLVHEQPQSWSREFGGRKYIRQRWDATSATGWANAGQYEGHIQTGALSGAPVNSGRVTYLRIRVTNMAGKTLRFKELRAGGRSTPTFVIGSDQAGPTELWELFASMASLGLRGYLAQYTDFLSSNAAAREGYLAAEAAGHEATWNDVTDRNFPSNITTLSAAQAAVRSCKAALASLGFRRGARIAVTNNNAWNDVMNQALAEERYVCSRQGRNTGTFIFPEMGVADPFRLPSVCWDDQQYSGAGGMQAMIDRVITYGCTAWVYWHGVMSDARMALDRTANVTGVVGAPIARSGTETVTAYRARVAALGTAAGNASVAYWDARIGSGSLGVWRSEIDQTMEYLAQKQAEGKCVIATPTEWAMDVGLLP